MLQSMSDPGHADDEAFEALTTSPSKAGDNLVKELKSVAEDEMQKTGKSISIDYDVTEPSADLKTGLLSHCKRLNADFLFLGPGVGGNGGMPPFAVTRANGMTVCIVRDEVE